MSHILENISKYHVILASNSPRRKELLAQLGLDFEVRTLQDIDESYPESLQGADVAMHIARKKADAYQSIIGPKDLVITADTIVCIDDKILCKPIDSDDARHMLHMLSGKTHQVVTAVNIATVSKRREFSVTTDVRFANLSDAIINYYIEQYRPFDKAGAYGIQEWIGYVGVESVNGSFFNVIGLPVQRLYQELQSF